MVTQDRDEELALFLEMRRREKEQGASLVNGSNASNNGAEISLLSKTLSSAHFQPRRTAAENFLYSENEKSDYDWLLTPPGTPQFEREAEKTSLRQLERPTVLKSRLGNFQEQHLSRSNTVSRQPTLSSGLSSSSIAGIRRPSSSGGSRPSSRPSTPTGRPTIPSNAAKPSNSRPSTPTSRATVSSAKPLGPRSRSSAPSSRSSAPSSRSSTPTSRATVSSTKSAAPTRSSTPTRSTARSTTPTARPSLPVTKQPVSRSSTPARRNSVPTSGSSASSRTNSVQKSAPTSTKVDKPIPSRGSSPTVRSRPWKPSEMPGFSLEAPPNLRTTLPDRPLSASRGRPGAPSSRSSSLERGVNERVRRQSSSPSRGRAPIGNSTGTSMTAPSARGRVRPNKNDNVSPVVMGNKMVERVVNMRKLGPPKLMDSSLLAKSTSSLDSSGYGRNLSKSSLDMALRHMDIRRSIPNNLRPLMTKVPASSMYSVRSSGSMTRSQSVSVSNSPLATSSNSSELSINNCNYLCLDGSEAEDNDLGLLSPKSLLGR